MTRPYQICVYCVMDTTDPVIVFDNASVCNHCKEYAERARRELHLGEQGLKELSELISVIKKNGENKEYDCVIGLSGGVDSTLVAYMVKQAGLRPLAVHLDNGWDDELAVANIEKTVKKLDADLYTKVIDWDVFKDLHLAFLKASEPNSEIPTDHAIVATLFHTAAEKGIKYIIHGGNIVSEAIMPRSWGYDAQDFFYIKAIHKKFGNTSLISFPHLDLLHWIYFLFIRRIRYIPLLNYVPYVKKDAKVLLEKELGWEDYGSKHFESVYTRFFQGYILPKKFGFDKRRAHLSTLICSRQITRDEALKELEHNPYPTEKMMNDDKEYVLKKLGLSDEEFENIMAIPLKTYKDYPNLSFILYNPNPFVKMTRQFVKRKH